MESQRQSEREQDGVGKRVGEVMGRGRERENERKTKREREKERIR